MDSRRNFLRGLTRAAIPSPGSRDEPARPADETLPTPVEGAEESRPVPPEEDRYADALTADSWGPDRQRSVSEAAVLVIGAGAIAGPVLTYLAGAGVGRLGVVDDADVARADLRADGLHYTPDVGYPKAHSAAVKLRFLNSEIIVEPYQVHLDEGNAEGLLADQDLVVDCSNDEATAAAVADACHHLGIALVAGSAGADGACVLTVGPSERACLRCARLEPAGEAWLPGPVAGMAGALIAREALERLVTSRGGGPPAAAIHLDVATPELRRVAFSAATSCEHSHGR